MDLFQIAISLGGIALCVMALVQFAFWSGKTLKMISQNEKQFEQSRELFRRQIESRSLATKNRAEFSDGRWGGFRSFLVSHLVKETENCTSVYLKPGDGKSIASFRPGQHLTFKFQIPGESKPLVRCYSLSNRPEEPEYRISVKAIPAPPSHPELPAGRVSNFIKHWLEVGDRVEVKAPSGHFVLDEDSTLPIVLLAGGIGITPMVSILNHLIATNSERLVLLMYGVQNAADHTFKQHFEQLAAEHNNIHIANCYSNADPSDVEGRDYHAQGFPSVELLKEILPDNECQFYVCGPPPFMDVMYGGLLEWGVPESDIFYEAFGPASIGKQKRQPAPKQGAVGPGAVGPGAVGPGAVGPGAVGPGAVGPGAVVNFANSGVSAHWDSNCASVLELAEANDISIDCGCRAGSCGTCAIPLVQGKVTYPDQQRVDCEPGKCLACIAKPEGPIELDA